MRSLAGPTPFIRLCRSEVCPACSQGCRRRDVFVVAYGAQCHTDKQGTLESPRERVESDVFPNDSAHHDRMACRFARHLPIQEDTLVNWLCLKWRVRGVLLWWGMRHARLVGEALPSASNDSFVYHKPEHVLLLPGSPPLLPGSISELFFSPVTEFHTLGSVSQLCVMLQASTWSL